MTNIDVKNAAKTAVGFSLGDAAGDLCMRTRCQDIIPRMLAGTCREAGRGRAARQLCKPLLRECQTDVAEIARCKSRCARYFSGEKEMKACVRDCNLARCRVFPLYDDCVARHTLLNLLACMEKGEGREDAVRCLKERCGVQASDRPLTPE